MQMKMNVPASARKGGVRPEQTAESARILIALVRREMTLPEALRALPGQMPMERAA